MGHLKLEDASPKTALWTVFEGPYFEGPVFEGPVSD